MSRVSASVHEQHLALGRATVGRLIEWQGRAVVCGLPKPTYSELLEVLVSHAVEDGVDIVRLLHAGEPEEGAA